MRLILVNSGMVEVLHWPDRVNLESDHFGLLTVVLKRNKHFSEKCM
jgi:hypothetical protein